ncbi:LIC12048 family lipoprotein [Leptospira sp. FAT2]|uniref:LIC12048 family lipoprotein n=1 Tax=Leptospira sanjuanensis TaxID=2879643 RepID=UPI001EE791C2|nr:LIC12048 family lipoprotein [Leptospira sanjuanensis]MCG6194327.1 LIC12048 family lipoprotein [Leptospira sanjuanensis]
MFQSSWIFSKIRFYGIVFLVFPLLFTCGWFGKDQGTMDNVDLAAATWLVAEQMKTQVNQEGVPVKPGSSSSAPITPVSGLFNLPPGKPVAATALMGTIDPTGTTIVNDFDGDGILNQNETLSNVWVADYPQIETTIAPPVTLKIQILKNSSNQSDQIVSEINSNDFEASKNEGSEKIHQNELNERTVQFQDSYSKQDEDTTSTSASHSFGMNQSYILGLYSTGFNVSDSASNSWGKKNGYSETVTKWDTKPFKNNLDRDAWNLKSDTSTNKARKYRLDKSARINETSIVEPNAGIVRAALYIKNLSVNMPVKISNILCSLMFETPAGELVPISSFRLRNDDYSLFEVEVYGGSDFGPYVVELTNLNTAEVEKAIAAGYTPKIMIVDYAMTHVPDSNYKSNLLNFSGNNLKIIEENAKGRTALLKLFAPNVREMFRVAAFDTPNVSNPCNTQSTDTFVPGISLKKALERIACSGNNIEFGDYVLDFTEVAPTLAESRVHIKGIKSFGAVQTSLPCNMETSVGSDGISRTACIQIPYSQWTDDQKERSGVWAVFSKGRFFSPNSYWKDSNVARRFDPQRGQSAAYMLKSLDSIIWPGDFYDIVYISFKDFIKAEQKFGTNPLETGNGYPFNTQWDIKSLGNHPYYPDTNSLFLGEVGFGEKIELKIQLNKTKYLNPNFGTSADTGTYQYFTNFNYNPQTTTDRYNINQAADFEISMGFGGTRTDWFHVVKDLSTSDPYKLKNCGTTLDFINQVYNLCVQLPTLSANVDPAISLVKLYIRPSLNNAYRKTVWPLHFSQVRKMRGEAGLPIVSGTTTIRIANSYGPTNVGDRLYIQGDPSSYRILQVFSPQSDGSFDVQLENAVLTNAQKTTPLYISGTLTAPDVKLIYDTGFLTDWNNFVASSFNSTAFDQVQYRPFLQSSSVSCSTNPFHPASCLGFSPDMNAINWMGVYNEGVALWNSWADGGDFTNFLYNGLSRLTALTGKTYRLESANTDFTVSADVNAPTLGDVTTVSYGDVALSVWRQGSTILGRYYAISTGQPLGNPFTINPTITAPTSGKYVVKAKNGKAVIVWENGQSLYVSIRDIATFGTLVSEMFLGNRYTPFPKNNFDSIIDIGIGNNRAMIVWSELYTTTSQDPTYAAVCAIGGACLWYDVRNYRVDAKVIRLDTGATINSSFNVGVYSTQESVWDIFTHQHDQISYYNVTPAIDVNDNNQAVIGWIYQHRNSEVHMIESAVYDLNTATIIGSKKMVLNETTRPTDFLQVGVTNAKGMLVWRRNDGVVLGRGIDMTNSNLLGTDSIILESGGVDFLKLSTFGDTSLLTYRMNVKDIRLKAINLQTSQLLYPGSLNLGIASADMRKPGSSILAGNKILTTWDQTNGTKKTIWGRISDLSTFTVDGPKEFQLSTTNEGIQFNPTSVVNNGIGFATWVSQDKTQQRIRGAKIDLNNPGALQYGLNNFFVAPLIERDYTVRARIKY